MLAIAVALMLSQCSKDTDCKGYRVCNEGSCVDPVAAPVSAGLAPADDVAHETVFSVPEKKAAANPFRPHVWVAAATLTGIWLATLIGDLAYQDELIGTTVVPVVGPFITYARWHDLEAAGLARLSPSGQALLMAAGVVQALLFTYLVVSIVGLATG